MLSTSASFRLITSNMERSLENVARQPLASREIAYYQENISSVKSLDDFMANDRLYRFAMKAFGLEDVAYGKGLIRKLLEQGIDDPESLANQLVDPRYREFATTFNFERYGTTTTTFSDASGGTVDRYVRQTLEQDAGEDNEGVRLALYFARKAAEIDSAFEILGDRALLTVVQTALGIPAASATQDIEKQAAEIEKRFDLADLKDPEKLDEFLTRFATLWEIQQPTTTPTNAALNVLQPAPFGIDVNTLVSLQSIKFGG